MTKIKLETFIRTSPERCFDVSRDVKIHQLSTSRTNERVIEGRTEGLFELNDVVTWEASHFGIRQRLTSKITKMDKPHFFEDIMLKGAFKRMAHEHYFSFENGVTKMTDIFEYEVPYGIFGWLFNKIILRKYMTQFLLTRNQVIREIAEKSPWD